MLSGKSSSFIRVLCLLLRIGHIESRLNLSLIEIVLHQSNINVKGDASSHSSASLLDQSTMAMRRILIYYI